MSLNLVLEKQRNQYGSIFIKHDSPLNLLEDSKINAKKRRGNIACVFGRAIDETSKFMKHYDAEVCYASKEYAFEETKEEHKLSSLIHLILTGGQILFELSDLPFDLAQFPII